ncbi:MAG TPA: hypothetical protein VJM33_04350 [Microthrixaceae bacterium]|nr:hypothetical protein [Microthrixaceae bacterium]
MSGGMSWAIVVPTGPGEAEVARIADILASAQRFEPDVDRIILVDDDPGGPRPATLLATAGALAPRTTVIANPRPREAHGWSSGVLIGVCTGFAEAMRGQPVDWVLRMDSDALLIGALADQVGARFADDPDLAIVGAYDRHADGTERDFTIWNHAIGSLLKPFAPRRSWRRPLLTSLFGRGKERRQLLEEAMRQGYQLGEHCQGGAYAISMRAIRAISANGWFDPRMWLGLGLPEDVIMGIYTRALGLSMAGMADPGEPFAVTHVGLPGTPRGLRDAGHGVVHSVKSHAGRTEADLREEFRLLREETI